MFAHPILRLPENYFSGSLFTFSSNIEPSCETKHGVFGADGWVAPFSAGAAERSAVFRGTRACMFEAAQPQVASPPEKLRGVREVWRSQPCARSRLSFAYFSLTKQRKVGARAGMRRKGEQSKTDNGYLKLISA
ncbi:hypothetical protein [Eikenella sp. Marseille-P7795]|uniref:hypothetical protein n=1 Tax=Eikenella sp. Marseille-P7795 TaxID=2866577 RepID=UPI001CE454CC|nr:hypothetical protein [Eikenella sp. Marseille-P7795]